MGLDLHLVRLSKPQLEAKDVYEEEDLDCYHSCPVEGCDLPRELIDRFAQLVTVNRQYWDMEAIYQAFKAQYPDQYPHDTKPDTVDFYPCGGHYGSNSISYTWEDYDRPCLIKLEGQSANDLDTYLTLEPTPTYVWDMENWVEGETALYPSW